MRTCAFILTADVREAYRRAEATRYCDAPAKADSSYCPHHHARCYKPIKAEAADETLPADTAGNEYRGQ